MHRFLASCLLASTLLSCATNPNSPIEALARQDVNSGRAIGAIVGHIGGRVIGRNTNLGEERGAALGQMAGTFAGQVIGQKVASRRLQYASEKDFLEAEIASSQRAISSKKQQISGLRERISDNRRNINSLERRARSHEDVTSEAEQEALKLDTTIANNEAALSKYKDTINYLDELIATSRKGSDEGTNLEIERNKLLAKRSEVQAQFRSLQDINQNATNLRARANRLAKSGNSSTRRSTSSGDESSNNPFNIPNAFKNFVPNLQ